MNAQPQDKELTLKDRTDSVSLADTNKVEVIKTIK